MIRIAISNKLTSLFLLSRFSSYCMVAGNPAIIKEGYKAPARVYEL